jgi:hypothetical protein
MKMATVWSWRDRATITSRFLRHSTLKRLYGLPTRVDSEPIRAEAALSGDVILPTSPPRPPSGHTPPGRSRLGAGRGPGHLRSSFQGFPAPVLDNASFQAAEG